MKLYDYMNVVAGSVLRCVHHRKNLRIKTVFFFCRIGVRLMVRWLECGLDINVFNSRVGLWTEVMERFIFLFFCFNQ
ncbi:hypothetical protein HanIR_Chr13g0652291 [Helianthus annuus]|nr:hypothetical protein HanIR_Chr13g0652291 [Helianthus annuus]